MQTEETHTCVYCGQPATHQFKNGKWCCQEKRYQCSGFKRRLSEKAKEVHQRFREQYGDRRSRKGRTLADTNRSSVSLVKYPSRGEHVCVYCGGHANYQLKDGRWCCHEKKNSCPEIRRKVSEGCKHAYAIGRKISSTKGHPSWCKGLTKETSEILRRRSETLKHRYQSGDLIHSFTGRHLSEEHKRKISESMKAAQKDGKAYNIGQCRWERKHSYPEEWLIGVIANEFSDKQYICEMSFHRFALDFAWVHKKKCIEVDGGWHDRPDQQERDRCKDELLKQEGWQVLRMPWKEVLKDKQGWIAKAKEFIDS